METIKCVVDGAFLSVLHPAKRVSCAVQCYLTRNVDKYHRYTTEVKTTMIYLLAVHLGFCTRQKPTNELWIENTRSTHTVCPERKTIEEPFTAFLSMRQSDSPIHII